MLTERWRPNYASQSTGIYSFYGLDGLCPRHSTDVAEAIGLNSVTRRHPLPGQSQREGTHKEGRHGGLVDNLILGQDPAAPATFGFASWQQPTRAPANARSVYVQ